MLLDLLYAALVAATLTVLAWALHASPAAIARHCAGYPGTVFVGAAHGAFIAIGLWGCSLLTPWHPDRPYLTSTAILWAGIHVVIETWSARRREGKPGLHRLASAARNDEGPARDVQGPR